VVVPKGLQHAGESGRAVKKIYVKNEKVPILELKSRGVHETQFDTCSCRIEIRIAYRTPIAAAVAVMVAGLAFRRRRKKHPPKTWPP
jgi:MYXO-CTERM domain-containing protein